MSNAIRLALSEHDTKNPLSPDELRKLASEMEDVLIENECQFSHPDWRYVDGLRLLARELTIRTPSSFEAANHALILARDYWKGQAEEAQQKLKTLWGQG